MSTRKVFLKERLCCLKVRRKYCIQEAPRNGSKKLYLQQYLLHTVGALLLNIVKFWKQKRPWGKSAFIFLIRKLEFSRSVMSYSLRPHESQHTRPPCPSPTPGVHPNSRPSSRWCHRAISSSVVPFSSCPQSLPASESFPMSQLFAWGGQSTGVSALASVLPMNTRDGLL